MSSFEGSKFPRSISPNKLLPLVFAPIGDR